MKMHVYKLFLTWTKIIYMVRQDAKEISVYTVQFISHGIYLMLKEIYSKNIPFIQYTQNEVECLTPGNKLLS